ncbi:GNAT family N-acetyltransferase [Photobacterium sp. TY1-4]|uniref:GNAT family N-acetyltransferase n=1 Tax=Photobacterium sp. TY1-4 TaxID=2899122 RepID=UPI0021BE0A26|nr:GNAT family N-acetyltransferase [Photobacterium sp. TY1-4]UXI02360.1 GNAT family N-acetyltransferase [Photobacterium sp. TY1-4]
MEIVEANESIRGALNQFYREQGYYSGWSHDERAFIATKNDEIIGSVKVESCHGISILRGMYIAEKYQGKGLGSDFINHIEPILNETLSYCMPLSHLGAFYGQIGFEVIYPDQLPGFLIQRYRGYENRGYRIIAMRREKSCSLSS